MAVDFESLRNVKKIDSLVAGLKKVASTSGGEYAGACPMCGGKDRFRYWPRDNRWMCRGCSGSQRHDLIDFVSARDRITRSEAISKLLKETGQVSSLLAKVSPSTGKETIKASDPPGASFQNYAWGVVREAQNEIKLGGEGLDYLAGRGLSLNTIDKYRLGYSSGHGFLFHKSIESGIVIPGICALDSNIWYLKIRCIDGTGAKYTYPHDLKGSNVRGALFGGYGMRSAAQTCIICEGEINAMSIYEACGESLPAFSLGSASGRPDLSRWMSSFAGIERILAFTDSDGAGVEGMKFLKEHFGSKLKPIIKPYGWQGKDFNDFLRAGYNIPGWLLQESKR